MIDCDYLTINFSQTKNLHYKKEMRLLFSLLNNLKVTV